MKEDAAIEQLKAINTSLGNSKLQVDKVGTETDSLIAEIAKLNEAAANEELSEEFTNQLAAVTAQAGAVKESVQAVDLKVIDQPGPDVPPQG